MWKCTIETHQNGMFSSKTQSADDLSIALGFALNGSGATEDEAIQALIQVLRQFSISLHSTKHRKLAKRLHTVCTAITEK